MKKTATQKAIRLITYILLIIFTLMCLYPLFWLFLSSFKENTELYMNPWGFPAQWRPDNYVNAIVKGKVL